MKRATMLRFTMLRPRLQAYTLVWFAIAAAVLLSDQYTKLWIMERYAYGDGEFFTGFFNLVRAHNYGAAFSFLRVLSSCRSV